MTAATQEKLAALWLEHYPAVVTAQARRGVGDAAAEDIAQQAFVRIGQYLERGAELREPLAALHTMANRVRIDVYRSEHPVIGTTEDGEELRAQFVSFDPALDADIEVEPEDEVVQYREHLDFEFAPTFDRALRALAADERDAFVLTELRGLTVREAADLLGTSYPTIFRRAAAAKTYIGKELAA